MSMSKEWAVSDLDIGKPYETMRGDLLVTYEGLDYYMGETTIRFKANRNRDFYVKPGELNTFLKPKAMLSAAPDAPGEPVAWQWEAFQGGCWETHHSRKKPNFETWRCETRNLRPLYTHPAPQAAVSEEMLEAAMHAYHGEGYDGRLRGCCVDVGEEEREDMRRAITAALRTGNGDELAERARAALQAAHLACFQHPDRGPVGMSRGPFSGVNEVLGVVAQLLASLKLETARAEEAEQEVERLRAALVEAGNAAGALISPTASADALAGVPEQVRRLVASLRARAEAAEARLKVLELKVRGADQTMAALEALVPDWRYYRDIVDAITCKMEVVSVATLSHKEG